MFDVFWLIICIALAYWVLLIGGATKPPNCYFKESIPIVKIICEKQAGLPLLIAMRNIGNRKKVYYLAM